MTGSLVSAVVKCFAGVVDMEVAEALAILEGLKLAVDDDLCDVNVESDAINVIKFCIGEVVSRCEVANVIHDIQLLTAEHSFSSFSFVPRSCNNVAHGAAR
ncbi:hypothetical protein ACOSQ2_026683 [Xanthoceras sorbifolium]